ncbi:hypothetical protein Taro_050594 [Colocasia esculenta]|uniref:Uncharacterized protein n=1 Tax=Colocasia esculenta TaxID=4460 RepID=A0A843XEG5_COLES|nr:hypothetical protein [Colocasia esculenta]
MQASATTATLSSYDYIPISEQLPNSLSTQERSHEELLSSGRLEDRKKVYTNFSRTAENATDQGDATRDAPCETTDPEALVARLDSEHED